MNVNRAGDYLLIPINICQFAIREKVLKEFHLLVTMKMISSGKIVWNMDAKKELAAKMKVTVRTIENIFPKLLKTNWIGQKGKVIYLRKFDWIAKNIQIHTNTGVLMYPDDLRRFRAFIIGAIMGYLVNMQKLILKKERRLGLQNKRGNNSTKCPSFLPIANSALAQILNCSISTACNCKQEAKNYKYIRVSKCFDTVPNMEPENIAVFKKAVPNIAHRVRLIDGKVVVQLPDLVAPNLRYKARKKLKYNKGGYRGNLEKRI